MDPSDRIVNSSRCGHAKLGRSLTGVVSPLFATGNGKPPGNSLPRARHET